MKIKTDKILDCLFTMFLFSSITISASAIGKTLQLFSIVLMLIVLLLVKPKFSIYNFIELLFVIFVVLQILFDITVIKESSFKVATTILYNFIFTLSIYNYTIRKHNMSELVIKYAKVTIFSLAILLLFNYKSLLNFRFNASQVIFGLIGGQSSTALSLIAAIPAFFLSIFCDEKNDKRIFPYILILLIFSFLTGTRKTLLIFIFILAIVYPLKNKKISLLNIAKIGIFSIILFIFAYVVMFKIPIVYNIIGYRIENAISIIANDQDKKFDASIHVRERLIKKSKELYNQKKITGWGMDYFRQSDQSGLGYYSHNNFYEILVGGGIIGFIIYYLKYLYLLFKALKNYVKQKNNIWLFIFLFITIMTIIEWWQVTYAYRYIMIYQALIIGFIYISSEKKEVRKNED